MISRQEKNKQKTDELLSIEKKKKRKRRNKIITIIVLTLTSILTISYLLLRYVGTSGLIVKEYSISVDILEEFNGLKIVHFADIHYGTLIGKKQFDKVIKAINHTNPDLVFFTGDLIDSSYEINNDDSEYLIEALSNIDAKLGKYAVKGEDDKESFDTIMNNTDFIVLNDKMEKVYYKNNKYFLLFGLNYNGDINALFDTNEKGFSIVLTHMPDVTDIIMESYNPDIIMAAHSHNGQIRLPFLDPLIKYDGSKKYNEPFYQIEDTKLYISSGIGTNKYKFRLFNHPSINFYRLRSNDKA